MCKFPASELLRMRRQLARQADESDDDAFILKVAEFIKGTDIARLAHAELTECNCWQRAVHAEDVREVA